jgi:hypothetical protein
MSETAGRAHVGFSRMAGCGLMPSHGSRPTTGSISVPNTTAATATDVTTVEEKISRNHAIPRIALWAATARRRPPMRPTGTTITT